jgi:hypothetical protein
MFRDLLPPGEQLRRAILWISEQRQLRPTTPTVAIVDEACKQFDLTPREEEFLLHELLRKA